MVKILDFLSDDKLKKMQRLGLIKEGRLQALKIYDEFWHGLKAELGSTEAITVLSKKYYLSEKRIQNIVYPKKNHLKKVNS